MKRQNIHCIGFSEGQILSIYEIDGKIEVMVSGPRGGIISWVQLNKQEFYSSIRDIFTEIGFEFMGERKRAGFRTH